MKPQSPFPTGVEESWGMCRSRSVDTYVRNQNYFRREIISQDSVLERATEPKFSNDKLPSRGPCNLTLIPWANDVNSLLLVGQADMMSHPEKKGVGARLYGSLQQELIKILG